MHLQNLLIFILVEVLESQMATEMTERGKLRTKEDRIKTKGLEDYFVMRSFRTDVIKYSLKKMRLSRILFSLITHLFESRAFS